jgi:hypothetical protein
MGKSIKGGMGETFTSENFGHAKLQEWAGVLHLSLNSEHPKSQCCSNTNEQDWESRSTNRLTFKNSDVP